MRPLPFPLLFCRLSRWLFQRFTLGAVASDFMSPIADAQALVSVFITRPPTSGQAAAPLCPFDLQSPLIDAHCVVSAHPSLVLDCKDQLQVLPFDFRKGAPRLL